MVESFYEVFENALLRYAKLIGYRPKFLKGKQRLANFVCVTLQNLDEFFGLWKFNNQIIKVINVNTILPHFVSSFQRRCLTGWSPVRRIRF